MSKTIDDAYTRIDKAAARLEDRLASLYRDGKPVFTPDVQAETAQVYLEEYDATAAAAVDAAEQAAAVAQLQLDMLGADLSTRLTRDELARASAAAAFVREDCEQRPLHELVERCRAALASGRRDDAYVWARYVEQRLVAEQGRQDTGSTDWTSAVDPQLLQDLQALVGDLKAVVDPTLQQRRMALQATLGRARGVRWQAEQKRPKLDALGNRVETYYSFQSPADVQW